MGRASHAEVRRLGQLRNQILLFEVRTASRSSRHLTYAFLQHSPSTSDGAERIFKTFTESYKKRWAGVMPTGEHPDHAE